MQDGKLIKFFVAITDESLAPMVRHALTSVARDQVITLEEVQTEDAADLVILGVGELRMEQNKPGKAYAVLGYQMSSEPKALEDWMLVRPNKITSDFKAVLAKLFPCP